MGWIEERFGELKDFKHILDMYRERPNRPRLRLSAYMWWVGDDGRVYVLETLVEEYNNFTHPIQECGLYKNPIEYISEHLHVETWDGKLTLMVLFDGQYFPPPPDTINDYDLGKYVYGAIYEVKQSISDFKWYIDSRRAYWLTSLETDGRGCPQLAKMVLP